MIRLCTEADTEAILGIVNDGARAYKGVIPADRWQEPYMSLNYPLNEIASGVEGDSPLRKTWISDHLSCREGRTFAEILERTNAPD